MTTELTVTAVLGVGLTTLSGVVTILWRKLEAYQTKLENKLEDTNKLLLDCEKNRFELLQSSIAKESVLTEKLHQAELQNRNA